MDSDVTVEIPKGDRNEYEMDHERGATWVGRSEAEEEILASYRRRAAHPSHGSAH